jgi:hypothetical protein
LQYHSIYRQAHEKSEKDGKLDEKRGNGNERDTAKETSV